MVDSENRGGQSAASPSRDNGSPREKRPMDFRREHVRRLLQVEAMVTSAAGDRSWPARIVDIARMGVAFVTDLELAPGNYKFCFSFPDSEISNLVLLDVLYSRPVGSEDRYRNGARFEQISDDVIERIVDYVTTGAEAMIGMERTRFQ
jgi:hypothetical protein